LQLVPHVAPAPKRVTHGESSAHVAVQMRSIDEQPAPMVTDSVRHVVPPPHDTSAPLHDPPGATLPASLWPPHAHVASKKPAKAQHRRSTSARNLPRAQRSWPVTRITRARGLPRRLTGMVAAASFARHLVPGTTRRAEDWATSLVVGALFRAMDLRLRLDPSYRRLVHRPGEDDWRARLRITTRDGSIDRRAEVAGGRVRPWRGGGAADATLVFRDAAAMRSLLTKTPSQVLDMLLTGDLVFRNNLSDVARLSFMLNALVPRAKRPGVAPRRDVNLPPPKPSLPMERCDEVRVLDDPGLSAYTLASFPRLERFKTDFFATSPEVCTERARLYTEHVREVGFEGPTHPLVRQAGAFHRVMTKRRARIREGDLLAGTTTSKDIGVIVYPECGGIPIWPELGTMSRRKLNPYRIGEDDARVLNDEVFPFWMDRNVREFARAKGGDPRSLQLDERFCLYFQWKTQAVSHTIADYPTVLRRGLRAIRDEALARAAAPGLDADARALYGAMATAIDGVNEYAANLSREAERLARAEPDEARRRELEEMARVCKKVPAEPAETLHEVLQSVWTVWIACHAENTNAGLSIGRLDQWLQPFFEADARRFEGAAKEAYVRRAIELVGCFFLRCTDHLPQVADLGNKLFGGSSSDQVITLGGVTPEGENGVCDMTYVLLKVTEMLGLRDPNVNARYYEGKNSVAYLRRLCEVNLLTGATPSIHNDEALVDVLAQQGMKPEHARDWSATGCVEPTSCGRHYGHTNCMMFNLVAPLEMALRDGFHPLIGEQVGPHTGDPRRFSTFDELLEAYFRQARHQIELAVEANNLLGQAHAFVRPTPFLSALIEGPMQRGVDLSRGGALYNSSGVGNVGLVDVVDSLAAIRKLVFDERRVDMATLLDALDADFEGHASLLARIESRVPKFGSGDPLPAEIAERVVDFCHRTFREQPHYRGGHYNSGFWSMSNHVAFGILTGALPSGRRKGKAFTPGLTPSPTRRATIVEHIHDVAALDHSRMPNNIAFNVKVVPGPSDPQQRVVDAMAGYVRTFVQEGGMQLQFNVVSSATLRDAMAHPENYRTLMVRVSGYNAYFNDLNDDMKLELIERTEHALS
jgi:pyruvate formate-lyase/glycerol dehydratase family glycyl radical enzyme